MNIPTVVPTQPASPPGSFDKTEVPDTAFADVMARAALEASGAGDSKVSAEDNPDQAHLTYGHESNTAREDPQAPPVSLAVAAVQPLPLTSTGSPLPGLVPDQALEVLAGTATSPPAPSGIPQAAAETQVESDLTTSTSIRPTGPESSAGLAAPARTPSAADLKDSGHTREHSPGASSPADSSTSLAQLTQTGATAHSQVSLTTLASAPVSLPTTTPADPPSAPVLPPVAPSGGTPAEAATTPPPAPSSSSALQSALASAGIVEVQAWSSTANGERGEQATLAQAITSPSPSPAPSPAMPAMPAATDPVAETFVPAGPLAAPVVDKSSSDASVQHGVRPAEALPDTAAEGVEMPPALGENTSKGSGDGDGPLSLSGTDPIVAVTDMPATSFEVDPASSLAASAAAPASVATPDSASRTTGALTAVPVSDIPDLVATAADRAPGRITISLTPEGLGQVTLNVQSTDKGLVVTVQGSDAALELVSRTEISLVLHSRGFTVASVDILTAQASSASSSGGGDPSDSGEPGATSTTSDDDTSGQQGQRRNSDEENPYTFWS